MSKERQHQDMVGNFLEHLPIKLKADLTFPSAVTEVDRDNAFSRWISKIQEQHRCSVGYVRGDEAEPHRHLHVVLVSHHELDLVQVQQAWIAVLNELYREWRYYRRGSNTRRGNRSGSPRTVPSAAMAINAFVQQYSRGEGGISYSAKSEGEAFCNVQFSSNLDLFSSKTRGLRQRSTTSRERRQARRIAAQRSPSPKTVQSR